MARLNVNPTRMVMSSLKKRLQTATRGHKLMKDKRDELIKIFIELARENKTLREKVEERLKSAYADLIIAGAVMPAGVLEESLMSPKQGAEIKVGHGSILSVDIPVFESHYRSHDISDIYPYGFAGTSGELDKAVAGIAETMPLLFELAETEKKAALLAEEIEKSRRRVNALEYIIIPDLKETIKYIRMKLDENERGNQARLMKVKDMMIKAAIEQKHAHI